MKAHLTTILFCSLLVAACSSGGDAASTVNIKNSKVGGNVNTDAIGGKGGTAPTTVNFIADPDLLGNLLPGKKPSDLLSPEEQNIVEIFCSKDPNKCETKTQ